MGIERCSEGIIGVGRPRSGGSTAQASLFAGRLYICRIACLDGGQLPQPLSLVDLLLSSTFELIIALHGIESRDQLVDTNIHFVVKLRTTIGQAAHRRLIHALISRDRPSRQINCFLCRSQHNSTV